MADEFKHAVVVPVGLVVVVVAPLAVFGDCDRDVVAPSASASVAPAVAAQINRAIGGLFVGAIFKIAGFAAVVLWSSCALSARLGWGRARLGRWSVE